MLIAALLAKPRGGRNQNVHGQRKDRRNGARAMDDYSAIKRKGLLSHANGWTWGHGAKRKRQSCTIAHKKPTFTRRPGGGYEGQKRGAGGDLFTGYTVPVCQGEKQGLKWILGTNVHSSTIHDSQRTETAKARRTGEGVRGAGRSGRQVQTPEGALFTLKRKGFWHLLWHRWTLKMPC